MVSDFCADEQAIIAVIVGMMVPVASNTDEAGRAKNRPVEVVAT